MSYSLSRMPTNSSRVFFLHVSPSLPFLFISAGVILRLVLVAWAEGKTCGEGHGPGHRARRGRTGQLQGQGQPGQERTEQDRTEQDGARQKMTGLDKIGQDRTGQERTGRNGTGHGRTDKGRAELGRGKAGEGARQGRARQAKPGQTRAGQGRASQGRDRGRRRDRAGWAGRGKE